MPYRFRFWDIPKDDPRFNPFSKPFDDMPSDKFWTRDKAREAALAFVEKYKDKSSDSGGGYNEQDDSYWIRDEVSPGRFRFTKFFIEPIT